ncbi:MAG: alkaline phosphatase D family protein [Chitinophagales bacterium]|nr:alkaline phosphatase D family protein [Chitinophagales bacterium]
MLRAIYGIVILMCAKLAFGQFITHGPVIGGATPTTARMYVRTAQAMPITVELSTDSNFSTVLSFNALTKAEKDSSTIFPLTGLQANTTYFYRVSDGTIYDTVKGQFKTFPNEGQRGRYDWVVVSCQEFGTYNAFNAIYNQKPHLFFHTGDWTYPDYQIQPDYRLDTSLIQFSYRRRYSEQKMPQVLRNTVTDYIYDNHDGAGAAVNLSFTSSSYDSATNTVTNYVDFQPIPPIAKQNTLKGYFDYFPSYPAVDSSKGLYHSYKFGNAEVFFVDVRNCGNGLDSMFRYDSLSNRWSLRNSPNATLLGADQMAWLKQGLRNSTADWKFIVSGVMFNKAFRKVIQYAMALQDSRLSIGGITGTGLLLAHSMAWNWAGYPIEQDAFLQYLEDNDVKDVIVLSGHVHTNVMDDGTNAGLPELNTGPVAGSGAELTYYIDSVMRLFGLGAAIDSLWNGGGMGVENQNFKSGFGKIEIYSNDSVVLRTIDEDNIVVSSMTIPHSSKVTSVKPTEPAPVCVIDKVYPNPTGNAINVKLCRDYSPSKKDKAFLIGTDGRIIPVEVPADKNNLKIDVKDLPSGNYIFLYDYPDGLFTKSVQVIH